MQSNTSSTEAGLPLPSTPPQLKLIMPKIRSDRQDLEDRYTKHPEFYFTDGSIVLIVQTTAFRVHQSVLSRHSDVFGGMWDVPQPLGVELMDGCPLVVLQDVVEDFTDTLRAVYDSFYFDNLTSSDDLKTLIPFISGILRISTKYNMVQLRKKCISIIRQGFPSTLEGCEAVLTKHYRYEPADVVRVIPLAHETNVPEVLPWAYYVCTHMSNEELLKSTILSWKDKSLCLVGKERLWQAQMNVSHTVLFSFSPAPICMSMCQAKVSTMINWKDAEVLRQSPHPLQEYDGWPSLKQQVCSKCLAYQVALHKKGRQQVWEMLPGIFELGTWEDIQKDQSC